MPPSIADRYDAERPAGLAALGHRIAVQHGCRRRRMARRAEQDCRDGIGGARGRSHAQEQRKGRGGVHVESERQQECEPGDAANPGKNSERQSHAHASEQIGQAHGIENDEQSLPSRVKHVCFHARSLPNDCGVNARSRSRAGRGLMIKQL